MQEYLQRWKKTLVVVSHDRDFLNLVTTDIIHLHDLGLHSYRGNFAQFEEMYDQRRREQNKVAEKFEKQLKTAKQSGSKAAADKVTLDCFAKISYQNISYLSYYTTLLSSLLSAIRKFL